MESINRDPYTRGELGGAVDSMDGAGDDPMCSFTSSANEDSHTRVGSGVGATGSMDGSRSDCHNISIQSPTVLAIELASFHHEPSLSDPSNV